MPPKKKLPPAPPAGTYALAVLHADSIRLDLYDECLPLRTSALEPGWGSATLTVEQALQLSRELSAAALRATPKPAKGKKK